MIWAQFEGGDATVTDRRGASQSVEKYTLGDLKVVRKYLQTKVDQCLTQLTTGTYAAVFRVLKSYMYIL